MDSTITEVSFPLVKNRNEIYILFAQPVSNKKLPRIPFRNLFLHDYTFSPWFSICPELLIKVLSKI